MARPLPPPSSLIALSLKKIIFAASLGMIEKNEITKRKLIECTRHLCKPSFGMNGITVYRSSVATVYRNFGIMVYRSTGMRYTVISIFSPGYRNFGNSEFRLPVYDIFVYRSYR